MDGAAPGRRLVPFCVGCALGACGVLLAAPAPARAADPAGTIYVADYGANSVDVFAPGASGDVAPLRTIQGVSTGLSGPADVAVDAAGDVYVSNFNDSTITEYAPGASGNAEPIRTIGGELTKLSNNDDIYLATDGQIYVGNFNGTEPVEVFAASASGDVEPLRTLGGEATGLALVDGVGADAAGALYVDSGSSIRVFAPGASGNVAPVRVIEGEDTQLGAPDDVKVGFDGELFVSDAFNRLHVFEAGASGDATPLREIAGAATELTNADDLAVGPGGAMYVTNFDTSNVVVFGASASGNAEPAAKIAGPETTLSEPEGIALAPPGAEATLRTQDSAGTIELGEATRDTATLEGGHSPTGQLIFKLFGPSDPSCGKAPAFTSGLIAVSGAGSYESPSFAPAAPGSYHWVAEYSGDGENAAKATGCGDSAEQVTVEDSSAPACSHLHGVGHWGPRGPGEAKLGDNLSTSLASAQKLQATGREGEFHLLLSHLTSASCVRIPGGLEFSGTGPAKFDRENGFTATFAFSQSGGRTLLTLVLERHGIVKDVLVGQQLDRSRAERFS